MIVGWGIYCEIALRWFSLDLIHDKSTLVQIMAWCHQATSHYLSQWWPRSLLPYDITRPEWVKWSVKWFMGNFKLSCWDLDLPMTCAMSPVQQLYSLSGKTSYGKISWSLEAARFGFRLFQSLWNFTGTSAAALRRCLSNFRALRLL